MQGLWRSQLFTNRYADVKATFHYSSYIAILGIFKGVGSETQPKDTIAWTGTLDNHSI